ncbi:type II secretion system F family protein [Prosthecodimorpha hirschii]|uniref:type II secretion system F family protein n=1 Tax=Prosthecodimorpha hirschii TaxID=665126 RepID=UPI001FEF92CA|nr:type II secretion system F family protein [Prosthecomicrobium hirschii]
MMPIYRTVVIDRQAGRIEALRQAPDGRVLTEELRRAGHFVLAVEPASPWMRLGALLRRDVTFTNPLPAARLAILSHELGIYLETGIALDAALALAAEHRSGPARRLIETLHRHVVAGGALSKIMADHPRVFPASYRAVIQAAETSGTLATSLQVLAKDLESGEAFASTLRGAMIYPAFLTVAAIGAILVMLLYVVPTLEDIVRLDNRPLPAASQVIITASRLVRSYGAVALGAGLLLAVGIAVALRRPSLRRRASAALLRAPWLGGVIRDYDGGRVLRALAVLTAGGVPLDRALAMAGPVASNQTLRGRFAEVESRVVRGGRLEAALRAVDAVPSDGLALVAVGERGGRLDVGLERAARVIEERLRRKIDRFTTLLSPTVTIVFGIVAGLVVAGMLTTILSINQLAL